MLVWFGWDALSPKAPVLWDWLPIDWLQGSEDHEDSNLIHRGLFLDRLHLITLLRSSGDFRSGGWLEERGCRGYAAPSPSLCFCLPVAVM